MAMQRSSLRLASVSALLLIVLFCGCARHALTPELERAEGLCEGDPKKAIEYIDKIKSNVSAWNDYQQHRYALLRAKAEIYALNPYSNDTLLSRLAVYFDKSGTAHDRMEAYYLLGTVLQDLHDGPQAVKAYLNVTKIGEQEGASVDTLLLAAAYSKISELNAYSPQSDQALQTAQRALTLLKLAHKAGPYDYAAVAWAFRLKDQDDSVRAYYRQALQIITENQQEERFADVIAEELGYYLAVDDRASAKTCLSLLHKVRPEKRPSNYALVMARYYDEMGQNDSVIHYAALASQSSDYFKKRDAAQLLNKVYAALGNLPQAQAAALQYIEANDSIDAQNQREELSSNQSDFNYRQKAVQELAGAHADARLYRQLLLVSASLVICLLAFILYLKWQRQRQKRLTKALHEARQTADLLSEENEATRQTIHLYARQAETARQERETMRQQLTSATSVLDELKVHGEDVIRRFKEAVRQGQPVRDENLWKELAALVKSRQPETFAGWMQREDLSPEKLKALCLHATGFSNGDIECLLGCSHSTAWRILTACGIVKKRK